MVINFYKQLATNFNSLQEKIITTTHSRAMHDDAWIMYNNQHLFDDLELAWAFWILTNQGFSCQISKTWSCGYETNKHAKKNSNKKAAFLIELQKRLDLVQIECRDALQVIKSYDQKSAFFYVDPPYFNANMGHYGGYKESDFAALLETLSLIEGKFILSSYPSEILSKYTEDNKWHYKLIDKNLAASKKGKRKTEVLTANFSI